MLLTTPPVPPVPPVPPATEHAPALYWRRRFSGDAEQARTVRRFVACLLAGCSYLDDVLLAVDELVVNALRHTKSGHQDGSFTLEVLSTPGRVSVSVTDQGGPSKPAASDADLLAESGRGLRTISHTATTWGWHGNDQSRTVTATSTGPWPC